MKHSPEILAELAEISPGLAQIPKTNIFSIPENYFKNFSENLFDKLTEVPFLPAKEIITQKVPEGYFENLAENILLKIKEPNLQSAAEEINILSSVVANIGNNNVFKVPSGYFANCLWNAAATTTKQAKIVSLNFRKRVLQYSVAAAVALLISISVFNYYNKSNTQLDNGLAGTAQSESVMATAKQIINNDSFNEVLEQLPENEIESYLEDRGLDIQAALVASSMEATDLPSAEDYLYNENALTDFLKVQNIQN